MKAKVDGENDVHVYTKSGEEIARVWAFEHVGDNGSVRQTLYWDIYKNGSNNMAVRAWILTHRNSLFNKCRPRMTAYGKWTRCYEAPWTTEKDYAFRRGLRNY